jgi:hypothetical protein
MHDRPPRKHIICQRRHRQHQRKQEGVAALEGEVPFVLLPRMMFTCLHLFFKDVFGATKTKKHGDTKPTYPDSYPFNNLHDFIEDCNGVVKFFHNHHAPKAQFNELQKTTSTQALVKAALTRWGMIKDMVKTLLQSEQHLHAIITTCDFVQGTTTQKEQKKAVRDTITD